jgi:hypothetical protein
MRYLNGFIYRNLHQPGVVYSVKDNKTGLVALHSENIVVKNAKFVVQKGGQEKVRTLKRKQVHAGVKGDIVVDPVELATLLPKLQQSTKQARYNPYQNDTFVNENNEVLSHADYVLLTSSIEGKSLVLVV